MERFRIDTIIATPNPQQVIWTAMHQDYSEGYVIDEKDRWPDEEKAGELIIKYLLAGNRGHYGPLEHPQITLNVGFFPHSMMQQLRTHRVGISFDVQCLAGDTEVTFVHSSGKLKKIKIADLHDLWTNGERAVRERKIRGRKGQQPGQYRRDCKTRLKKMRLRVLNEKSGYFQVGHVKDVMCSGVQPVYRLTLEDGKTLDCTTNHQLFTSEGWQHMGDALGLITNSEHKVLAMTKHCRVMCNGIVRYEALYTQKSWFAEQVDQGLTAKDIAEKCDTSPDDIRHWAKQRQLTLSRGHKKGLKTIFAQQFQPLDPPQDWNPKPRSIRRTLAAHPVAVVGVEYLGLQTTYDLEVEGDWHNFVANGVVVHNSFRYTGQRIIDVATGAKDVEEVFYLRPIGQYDNRQGKKYQYTAEQRAEDLQWCLDACKRYKQRIEEGLAEEHARGLIPFDARQNFVVSCNTRSLMHLLDLRWKKDAQLEAQKFCELLYVRFEEWCPAVAHWYEENRAKKARLSP